MRLVPRTILASTLSLLLFPAMAAAQTPPAPPSPGTSGASGTTADAPPAVTPHPALEQRLQDLLALFRGEGDYAALFAPAFRNAVPEAQVRALIAQLRTAHGTPDAIADVRPGAPNTATFTIHYPDADVQAVGSIEENPPHRFQGLRITGIAPRGGTLESALSELRALPGISGYALARLHDDAPPELVQGDDADTVFAIGSAFKLWIFAELVRATNAGERHWDDVVTIDGTPLPGGEYRMLPAGAQVTLRDLATRMISVSDNSATDILLHFLGRARVEAMIETTGVAPDHAARNRPLPTTLELFKLKGANGGALGTQWIAADEDARRAMLAGAIMRTPVTAIDPAMFATGVPLRVEQLEYFASPMDMVRTMDWLRRNTQNNPEARAILSVNPGIPEDTARHYSFVGYKGGSESGVIHMTLLLRGPDAQWRVLTASWNNPDAAVDDMRFIGLIGAIAAQLAPDATGPAPRPAP